MTHLRSIFGYSSNANKRAGTVEALLWSQGPFPPPNQTRSKLWVWNFSSFTHLSDLWKWAILYFTETIMEMAMEAAEARIAFRMNFKFRALVGRLSFVRRAKAPAVLTKVIGSPSDNGPQFLLKFVVRVPHSLSRARVCVEVRLRVILRQRHLPLKEHLPRYSRLGPVVIIG